MSNTIHLIGSAHLDPVWLWRYEEGLAEIKATFQSALDRLDEFDDFVFTCSSASYYKWVEKNAPEMFEKIRQRVKEGRWIPVGGWWVQADCNIPSGESFARQALYSQRYYREKFGITCTVGYNVDSFGHNGMLPQLLRQSGMDSYVFMRPENHERQLPFNLFRWKSPDGSEVLTYRIVGGYACKTGEAEKLEQLESLEEFQNYDMMLFYGVGNHGGGPTIRNLRALSEQKRIREPGAVEFSSPVAYFRRIRESGISLPELSGSLRHHSPGCYSANSKIKKDNRLAENRLASAEWWSVLAQTLLSVPYPGEKLREAWETVLFHQFHDVLAGCCIREACGDSGEALGFSLNIASQMQNAAIQRISWDIDTMGGQDSPIDKCEDWQLWYPEGQGAPIVAFNPLPFERECEIEVNAWLERVKDSEGNEYPVQTVRASRTDHKKKWNSVFRAKLPALGYQLFWGFQNKGDFPERTFAYEKWGDDPILENDHIRLQFDAHSGAVKSCFLKEENTEFVENGGAQAILVDETDSDTWGHRIVSYAKETGRFANARFVWLEKGPVRSVLRVETSCSGSSLRQDFILYHDAASVKVRCKLDFHEKHRMMKLSFPIKCEAPECITSLPFGWEKRPCDSSEDISQKWLALAGCQRETGKKMGMLLTNDCKYGFSADGSELRLTIARGAIYADHFGERDELCEYMDQGEQEFQYEILPWCGEFQAEQASRKAMELNFPAVTVLETYHHGKLPARLSGISISDSRIGVSAWKESEDGEGYILRCSEMSGRSSQEPVRISLPTLGRNVDAVFPAFVVKTFYIPKADGEVKEVNFLEDFQNSGSEMSQKG